ncbi:glycosyltransferase, partial [Actinoplanes cyaneus]|uniref:glycosyltransferase n=1 Tax=Actinoplanes cyaneus TaxID=52696 RepID=UPI0031D67852
DGDVKNDLETLVSEEGLDDRVEFTGLVPREDIPEILDDATIGVAPLKKEDTLEYAVPTKAYEYMSFELPVVATGMGEIEVLIEESGGGVFVENDPQRLAEAFDALLADPERREQLGRNGREHVIERYDRGVVASRLSAVLDEVSVP